MSLSLSVSVSVSVTRAHGSRAGCGAEQQQPACFRRQDGTAPLAHVRAGPAVPCACWGIEELVGVRLVLKKSGVPKPTPLNAQLSWTKQTATRARHGWIRVSDSAAVYQVEVKKKIERPHNEAPPPAAQVWPTLLCLRVYARVFACVLCVCARARASVGVG
eukprot:1675280-Rhodomonas_salina.1